MVLLVSSHYAALWYLQPYIFTGGGAVLRGAALRPRGTYPLWYREGNAMVKAFGHVEPSLRSGSFKSETSETQRWLSEGWGGGAYNCRTYHNTPYESVTATLRDVPPSSSWCQRRKHEAQTSRSCTTSIDLIVESDKESQMPDGRESRTDVRSKTRA